MIKVRIHMDRMGSIIGRPVRDDLAERFRKMVVSNGGPNTISFYFQEGFGASEFLGDCSPTQRRELSKGWDITILVDPWIVGHWYGYDAHLVAE